MQDLAKVNLDTCIAYMELESEEHNKLFDELNSLHQLAIDSVDSIIK